MTPDVDRGTQLNTLLLLHLVLHPEFVKNTVKSPAHKQWYVGILEFKSCS